MAEEEEDGGEDGPSRVAWRIVGSEDMFGGVGCSAWQPMAKWGVYKMFQLSETLRCAAD